MKVLIISSSPRKGGNSDVLCDQFAKGAAAAGHDVESVSLREKKLSPCRACYACMENHICAINDDMAEIFPKLVATDVIVLASPVYFYSICSHYLILFTLPSIAGGCRCAKAVTKQRARFGNHFVLQTSLIFMVSFYNRPFLSAPGGSVLLLCTITS